MKMLMMWIALLFAFPAQAQVPVTANADHEAMLRHADPKLAANKRFVYDFWREVFEAAHMDLVPHRGGQDRRALGPGRPAVALNRS